MPLLASPDPEAARRAAHDILTRREFASVHPSTLDRLRHWFSDQLGRILSGGWQGLSAAGIVLLVAIVAVVAVVVVAAVRRVSPDPRVVDFAVDRGGRSAADWLAEAEACERGQDYRGALRARYRALVAELARRGLVEEVPGRTAGEYRRAVAAAVPPAAGEFGAATDLFEDAVYGDVHPGADDSRRIRALADGVLETVR